MNFTDCFCDGNNVGCQASHATEQSVCEMQIDSDLPPNMTVSQAIVDDVSPENEDVVRFCGEKRKRIDDSALGLLGTLDDRADLLGPVGKRQFNMLEVSKKGGNENGTSNSIAGASNACSNVYQVSDCQGAKMESISEHSRDLASEEENGCLKVNSKLSCKVQDVEECILGSERAGTSKEFEALDHHEVEKSEDLHIFVQTYFQQRIMVLHMKRFDRVDTVLQHIRQRTGVPSLEQRLLFKGRQLSEDGILEQYGVSNDSTLHLVSRLRSTSCPEVWIRVADIIDSIKCISNLEKKAAEAQVVPRGPHLSRSKKLGRSGFGSQINLASTGLAEVEVTGDGDGSHGNAAKRDYPNAGVRLGPGGTVGNAAPRTLATGYASARALPSVIDGRMEATLLRPQVGALGMAATSLCSGSIVLIDPEATSPVAPIGNPAYVTPSAGARVDLPGCRQGLQPTEVDINARLGKYYRDKIRGAVVTVFIKAVEYHRHSHDSWNMKLAEYMEAFRMAGGPKALVALLQAKEPKHHQFAVDTIRAFIDEDGMVSYMFDYPCPPGVAREVLDYCGPLLMEICVLLDVSFPGHPLGAQCLAALSQLLEKLGAAHYNAHFNRTPDWVVRNLSPFLLKSASKLSKSLQDIESLVSGRAEKPTQPLDGADAKAFAAFAIPVCKAIPYSKAFDSPSLRTPATWHHPLTTGAFPTGSQVSPSCTEPIERRASVGQFVRKGQREDSLPETVTSGSNQESGSHPSPARSTEHSCGLGTSGARTAHSVAAAASAGPPGSSGGSVCGWSASLDSSPPLSDQRSSSAQRDDHSMCSSSSRTPSSFSQVQAGTPLSPEPPLSCHLHSLDPCHGGPSSDPHAPAFPSRLRSSSSSIANQEVGPRPDAMLDGVLSGTSADQHPVAAYSHSWLPGLFYGLLSDLDRCFHESTKLATRLLHLKWGHLGQKPELTHGMTMKLLPDPLKVAIPTILKGMHAIAALTESTMVKFLDVLARHRGVINALITNAHLWPEGDLFWLLEHRGLLEFEVKRRWVMALLPEPSEDHGERHTIVVHRGPSLLAESFEQVAYADAEALKEGLVVRFANEDGAGAGVLREWFMLVEHELFNPDNGLFAACPTDRQRYLPSATSQVNPGHLAYFRFAGRVVALALMHHVYLDVTFSLAFFKLLAGRAISWKDAADADPQLFASCQAIVNMPAAEVDSDVLGLTFVYSREELGQVKQVELCPGGDSIKVTSVNRQQFVDLLVKRCLAAPVAAQASAVATGFSDVLEHGLALPQFLKPLEGADLEALLYGEERPISVADWAAHTDYHGYRRSDPEIQLFWNVVENMTDDERRRLLYFSTAITRLPPEGFAGLSCRFHIHMVHCDTSHLPSAHTCFHQLLLPPFSSYALMRARLHTIITDHCVQGFGFV